MDSTFLSNANGFAILTSAMFAIAQYSDTKHKDAILDWREMADKLVNDRFLEDERINKDYDHIMNTVPIRASNQIICLFLVFLLLSVFEAAILISSHSFWLNATIVIIGCSLVVIGGWLGVCMIKMGRQRRHMYTKFEQLEVLCGVAKRFSKN